VFLELHALICTLSSKVREQRLENYLKQLAPTVGQKIIPFFFFSFRIIRVIFKMFQNLRHSSKVNFIFCCKIKFKEGIEVKISSYSIKA
jgi:amino acid permease